MLSSKQVQLLNAVGPFNHSVWRSGDICITSEEALTGRAELLLSLISNSIKEKYSDVSELNIADVGCYDGWLIHNLQSELHFKSATGYEPREKNIIKGKTVRDVLEIKELCHFINSDLNSATDYQADIVTCCGLLHHLEDVTGAIRKLRKMTKKTLYLEFACTSDEHISASLEKEAELKDIVYKFWPKKTGITIQKLESNYYDGSASGSEFTLVSVPSVNSVSAALVINGFSNIKVLIKPEEYRGTLWGNQRPAFAVVMCADVNSDRIDSLGGDCKNEILDYEHNYLTQCLNDSLFQNLSSKKYCDRVGKLAKLALNGDADAKRDFLQTMNAGEPLTGFQHEIVNNLPYAFEDKLKLENAKYLMLNGQNDSAESVLKGLVATLNADWRSSYRAFFLLAMLNKENGDSYLYFKRLCSMSNHIYETNWEALEEHFTL